MMLISETASAGAAIGSWRGRSVIRACRVGRSLILVDLIDLAVRNFKHCGDLGDSVVCSSRASSLAATAKLVLGVL